jgi:redox-sensing transcriptional repressor
MTGQTIGEGADRILSAPGTATGSDPAVTSGLDAAPAVRDLPEATVARLAQYLRVLVAGDRTAVISSADLARSAGVNPALLRKDLSFLGSRGTRGVGYSTGSLADAIRTTLGTHLCTPVALVGIGHLGRALAGYRGFAERGLQLSALFDADPAVIGTRIGDLPVHAVADVAAVCRSAQITIGVIATPEGTAQEVADLLVAAGVRSILNFAPEAVSAPGDVEIRRVDLASELQILAFHQTRRGAPAVSG